jgi:MFS family permease
VARGKVRVAAGAATLAGKLRSYGELLGGRDFRLLFAGQLVSQFGDWINRVALLVLAYQLTGQGIAVALLMLASLLPRVVMLPFGGVLADRYPKRRLMLLTDLLRAALAASLVLVDSVATLWWAGAAVILLHCLAAIFNPARNPATPALVPAEGLGAANALNNSAMQLALFLGPAIGGWLVALAGVDAVFLINGATFLFSAALLWAMRLPEPPRKGLTRGEVGRDLREGWATVVGQRGLALLCACVFIGAVVAIGLNVLLVGLLDSALGQPTEQLGLLLTSVGLGMIAGAAPALGLYKRFTPLPLALAVTLGVIATMATIGATRSFLVVAVALFANGVLTAISDVVVLTTAQRSVPQERLGRVMGLIFWINALGQAVGALGGGLLPRAVGDAGATLVLSGVCALLFLALLPPAIGELRLRAREGARGRGMAA